MFAWTTRNVRVFEKQGSLMSWMLSVEIDGVPVLHPAGFVWLFSTEEILERIGSGADCQSQPPEYFWTEDEFAATPT